MERSSIDARIWLVDIRDSFLLRLLRWTCDNRDRLVAESVRHEYATKGPFGADRFG